MKIEALNSTPYSALYARRDTSVFSITMAIPGGAMAEEEGQLGYAHLLEHMLFRGTKTYPTSKDLAMEIEGVGGRYNGFTTFDAIYLTATVPASFWRNAVDVVFSLAYEPLLEETALSTEKQVVISEIQMSEDQPEERAYSHLQKLMWNGHRMGEDVAGRRADVENATKSKIQSFWERLFSKKPCVAMAGPIDIDEIQNHLDQITVPFELDDSSFNVGKPEFHSGETRIKEDTQQLYYRLALKGVEASSDDILTYQLMSNILGGSSFSQLFLRIREQEGLSYSVYSSIEATSVAGALIIACDLKPNGLDKAREIVQEELQRLSEGKISDEELERFKRFTVGAYTMSLESTSTISMLLADRFLTRGRIWDPESEINYINSMDADKISSISSQSLASGTAEVVLGP
jgi:predicted Zn-dependent peptidase